jgi:hypothetical protein
VKIINSAGKLPSQELAQLRSLSNRKSPTADFPLAADMDWAYHENGTITLPSLTRPGQDVQVRGGPFGDRSDQEGASRGIIEGMTLLDLKLNCPASVVSAMNGYAADLYTVPSPLPGMRAVAKAIVVPLGCFLGGVALGVACAAAGYLGQACFTRHYSKAGTAFQVLGIVLIIAGLTAFITGALGAVHVFSRSFGA